MIYTENPTRLGYNSATAGEGGGLDHNLRGCLCLCHGSVTDSSSSSAQIPPQIGGFSGLRTVRCTVYAYLVFIWRAGHLRHYPRYRVNARHIIKVKNLKSDVVLVPFGILKVWVTRISDTVVNNNLMLLFIVNVHVHLQAHNYCMFNEHVIVQAYVETYE